jgi:predicted metal-dependent peptidase
MPPPISFFISFPLITASGKYPFSAVNGPAYLFAENSSSGRQVGSVPAEIIRLVKQLKEPKINWRNLIYNNIQSHIKSDCSFMRWSKRSTDIILLPGRLPEDTIKVAVAIDVSGSISQDVMTLFISEIYGLMSQYASFSVTIWSFDTKINSVETFTEENKEDLLFWEPVGGGGTNIKKNFDYIKKNQLDFKTLIILTDLEDGSERKVNPMEVPDTVWIIKNDYKKDIKPPFGVFAYID